MTKKKQKSKAEAVEKKLKASVKKLKSQLAAAEKSAEKWKARAKDEKSKASALKAELSDARRRLAETEPSPAASAAPESSVEQPGTVLTAAAAPAATPDDGWTVTALRAEARSRGLAGYSQEVQGPAARGAAR